MRAALALLLGAVSLSILGCTNQIYQYTFRSGSTPSRFSAAQTPATREAAKQRAVLLVPAGVWVQIPTERDPARGSLTPFEANGPLRVFVTPGFHTLNVNLIAELDAASRKHPAWSVEQHFEPAEAYALVAVEGTRQVDWQLLEVSPSAYAELHAGDALLPTIGN